LYPIYKPKDYNIQNYKFTCCFVWCGSWSLTSWEEHSLGAVRRLFGPERKKVPGDWRKWRNVEVRN